jgi:hypothetical protein
MVVTEACKVATASTGMGSVSELDVRRLYRTGEFREGVSDRERGDVMVEMLWAAPWCEGGPGWRQAQGAGGAYWVSEPFGRDDEVLGVDALGEILGLPFGVMVADDQGFCMGFVVEGAGEEAKDAFVNFVVEPESIVMWSSDKELEKGSSREPFDRSMREVVWGRMGQVLVAAWLDWNMVPRVNLLWGDGTVWTLCTYGQPIYLYEQSPEFVVASIKTSPWVCVVAPETYERLRGEDWSGMRPAKVDLDVHRRGLVEECEEIDRFPPLYSCEEYVEYIGIQAIRRLW